MTAPSPSDLFQRLEPAEQDLVIELALASGSLKALAKSYAVSYPTIRARLDRLIRRIEGLRGQKDQDLLADKLADLVQAGSITPAAAREVLALHRSVLQDEGPSLPEAS